MNFGAKSVAHPGPRPLKTLHVHHVGLLGGSSRSLYEMLQAFPAGTVNPHFLGPGGLLSELLSDMNIPSQTCRGISQFDNCAYSYYRGFRWGILLREAFLLFPTYHAMKSARARWGSFDIVHVNDITMPFVVWLAKRLFPESKIVVHARAVQNTMDTRRKRWLQKLYLCSTDALIAINLNVLESLPAGLPARVIHNGMAVPADCTVSQEQRDRPFCAAMVGVLSRAKGCLDFIEAAAICRDKGYGFRFLLIGGGLRAAHRWRDAILRQFGLKEDIGEEVEARIRFLGLENTVLFRPFTTDLASIYRDLDVLCFPSFLDAPGRPIFEAGFFGIPSIAAIGAPKTDTFIDGKTGICIPPGDPEKLAAAIIRMYEEHETRTTMGAEARKNSLEKFDAHKNSLRILELYRDLCRNPYETDSVSDCSASIIVPHTTSYPPRKSGE